MGEWGDMTWHVIKRGAVGVLVRARVRHCTVRRQAASDTSRCESYRTLRMRRAEVGSPIRRSTEKARVRGTWYVEWRLLVL